VGVISLQAKDIQHTTKLNLLALQHPKSELNEQKGLKSFLLPQNFSFIQTNALLFFLNTLSAKIQERVQALRG